MPLPSPACLSINTTVDVDLGVLEEIVRRSYAAAEDIDLFPAS